MDRSWKLGEDLSVYDSLLDGVTFQDLIIAVKCNCQRVDLKAIKETAYEIIEGRLEDFWFLVTNNADEIALEALKGRSQ